MIIEFLVGVVLAVLGGFLSLIPSFELPEVPPAMFGELTRWLNAVNAIFPIDTLFTIMGLALALWMGVFAWNFVLWLWARLPFKST